MGFKPGHQKYGGRKKGSVSISRATVREIVEASLGQSIPEAMLEIAKEQPQFRREILRDLLPYTYPKLQSTEVKAQVAVSTAESIEELALWLKGMDADLPPDSL